MPTKGRPRGEKLNDGKKIQCMLTSVIRSLCNIGLSSCRAIRTINCVHLDFVLKKKQRELRDVIRQFKTDSKRTQGSYTQKDLSMMDREVFEAYVADILSTTRENRREVFKVDSDYDTEEIWRVMRQCMKTSFNCSLNETLEQFQARLRVTSILGDAEDSRVERLAYQSVIDAEVRTDDEAPEPHAVSDRACVAAPIARAVAIDCLESIDKKQGCRNQDDAEDKRYGKTPEQHATPWKRTNSSWAPKPSKKAKGVIDQKKLDEFLSPIERRKKTVEIESHMSQQWRDPRAILHFSVPRTTQLENPRGSVEIDLSSLAHEAVR
jgi:hypothetical protein